MAEGVMESKAILHLGPFFLKAFAYDRIWVHASFTGTEACCVYS